MFKKIILLTIVVVLILYIPGVRDNCVEFFKKSVSGIVVYMEDTDFRNWDDK